MSRLLVVFLVALFIPVVSQAKNLDDIVQCLKTCLQGAEIPAQPTQPASKVFPDIITFDNTSDQGAGQYFGTACVLLPARWEGRVKSVVVNGETAFLGESWQGRPVFRLLQTGDKYKRPLEFTITDTSGQVYTAKSNAQASPPATGATGKSVAILWKTNSENDGNLVVLLPSHMRNPPVAVLDMSGKLIENGRFDGFANGNRAHYRFTRPGRDFPLKCLLKVGSTLYLVKDASQRLESLPTYTMQ